MDGWIKLYRKITENPLYFSEAFTRLQAWIDLLIIANHDESYIYVRGNKVEIKRGQVGKAQDTLADRWKWSRGKVDRFLKELEKSGQIVRQKNSVMFLISIVNYEVYQCGSTTESTADKTTDDTPKDTTDGRQIIPQNGQQTDQQTDVNKNVKKNNILSPKVDNIPSPPKGEEALTPAPASKAADPKMEDEEIIQPEPSQKKKPLPAKKIADMWNATCTSYPKIFTLSDARKNKIRIRVEEMGGIEKAMPIMQTIFKKMQESKFLKGESKRGWKASFDWVFENAKNWVKVWEGNYDEKKDDSPAPEEPKKRNYDEKIF